MALLEFLPFNSGSEEQVTVFNVEEIPKEFDIFFRDEASFLPEGKTFEDLTPEELERLKNQYRFSTFRPGMYQTLTMISNSRSGM